MLGTTGAMGAPLIGPLRESLQADAGITRAALGLGYLTSTLVGSLIGLTVSMRLHSWPRTSLFRLGTACVACGLGLVAAHLGTGAWLLASMAAAWVLVMLGLSLVATGNGIFSDLWDHRPHEGVLMLHSANATGKLIAPLSVLAVGTNVPLVALGFACVFGAYAIVGWTWPRADVAAVGQLERQRHAARTVGLPRFGPIWLAVSQLFFIAGMEHGAISILGSFFSVHRASPVAALGPERWAVVAICLMLLGVLGGRLLFWQLSWRFDPGFIVPTCILVGFVGAVPAAISASPWVYVPSLIVAGVAFSSTWPAYWSMVARHYPNERTFVAVGGSVFSTAGIAFGTAFSSAIGNRDTWLPWAFLAAFSLGLVPLGFLFLTSLGRRLRGPASEVR